MTRTLLTFITLLLSSFSRTFQAGQWNFPKFEIVSGPQETVLQSGLTSTLDCSALSPEVPEVVWTKDGIALDPRRSGERRQLSNGSLVLSGSESLAGVYQCSLSLDSVGTILSPPALVRPPGTPEFLVQPRSLTVYQTQTAVFQCEVREGGDRVRWLKNDTPLQLDHRMTVLPSGGLEIRNVNYPDRGSYSCIAGSLVSSKADLNLKALVANPAPEPPSFLVTPVGKSVVVGQEVTLECSANGLPQPALTWLKDGREIELEVLDTRYVRTGSGSLTITGLELEDEGGYQCRAENTEDSVDSGVQLMVNLAPSLVK